MVPDGSLGDKRNEDRLKKIYQTHQNNVGSCYANAAYGDNKAEIKGERRFLNNKSKHITIDNMMNVSFSLTSHLNENFGEILTIGDGCYLNYSGKVSCKDLGQIGKNQTPTVSMGLVEHGLIAVSPEGCVGGVVRSDIFASEGRSEKKLMQSKKKVMFGMRIFMRQ